MGFGVPQAWETQSLLRKDMQRAPLSAPLLPGDPDSPALLRLGGCMKFTLSGGGAISPDVLEVGENHPTAEGFPSGFLVRNGCGQPLAVLSFKVMVGCLGMRANRKVLPSCRYIWAPQFPGFQVIYLCVARCLNYLACGKRQGRSCPSAIRPYRDLRWRCVRSALFCREHILVFQQQWVTDCGRTAWEPPDCQASKAAGRSIRWIRWIRPVLRRTDTSLRVRAPQIHQIPGQTQFPAVSECFRCLTQYIIDQSVIPFWETRPEITDNDGKPYLCADKAWTNVLFPGDSTGNWGLTSSSSSSIIHDLGIPINQPMLGFEHCLNRSDDAWMVMHQNVLLMESSSLWDSAKSR